ncbi:rod shape-determining protein MreD [Falsihalocynthiibacter sp. SS001]|uniref:rod shape-determining protein MreD n=1 Tax=Falsihalocynthiibacter sp. SS001 TaxID=3349698 RepID=UPI0036D2D526
MSEPSLYRTGFYALLYILASSISLFFHLLPLTSTPGSWAAPDVILCLTYVLVLRRPKLAPIGLVAIVFLVFDLFLMRPPGLMAAYVVIGAEFLRSRTRVNSELPFLVEWALAAGVIFAVLFGYRLTLLLVALDVPRLGLDLQYLIGTVVLYPMFALIVERFIPFGKIGRSGDSTGQKP